MINTWREWKAKDLVNDTVNDPEYKNLSAYLEWALTHVSNDQYRKAINAVYSWCYVYAELIDGISLIEFNSRFKKATEKYLRSKS